MTTGHRQEIGRELPAAGVGLVDQRCVIGESVLRVEDAGKWFVLDLDERDCPGGGFGAGSGNGGDLITELPYLVLLERQVVLQKAVANLGNVVASDNCANPGHLLGFRGVDVDDAGMGMLGELDSSVEHARKRNIVDIAGPPGDLVGTFRTREVGSYMAEPCH